MEDLAAHRALGSGKDWERSSAGEDIVAVEGNHLEEGRTLVAGVEGACLRSLVREGRVSAMEKERSLVEEDREIGFEEGIVVGLHSRAEAVDHPDVGYHRSNRYSTL